MLVDFGCDQIIPEGRAGLAPLARLFRLYMCLGMVLGCLQGVSLLLVDFGCDQIISEGRAGLAPLARLFGLYMRSGMVPGGFQVGFAVACRFRL